MLRPPTLPVAGALLLGALSLPLPTVDSQAHALQARRDFRRLAECAAKLDAVGSLYKAAALHSGGDAAIRLNARADQRKRAAGQFRTMAEAAERTASSAGPGAPPAGFRVAQVIRETGRALEAERERRPFEEFAVWLGSESDRCAPLLPTR